MVKKIINFFSTGLNGGRSHITEMPQFYHPVLLSAAPRANEYETVVAWVNPDKYGCDMRLLSHAVSSAFVGAVEMMLTPEGGFNRGRLVWAGDYADDEPEFGTNIHKMCDSNTELFPEESDTSYYGFIVNHTKGQFVSKERCEKYTKLHPLPLLTAEGNGCTDGDYPRSHGLLGYWARDELSVVKQRPDGLVEIVFDLA